MITTPPSHTVAPEVSALILRSRRRVSQSRQCVGRTRDLIARSRRQISAAEERMVSHADRTGEDIVLIRYTARRIAEREGQAALLRLYEEEVVATGNADRLSAEAWADIALEVERSLRAKGRSASKK